MELDVCVWKTLFHKSSHMYRHTKQGHQSIIVYAMFVKLLQTEYFKFESDFSYLLLILLWLTVVEAF